MRVSYYPVAQIKLYYINHQVGTEAMAGMGFTTTGLIIALVVVQLALSVTTACADAAEGMRHDMDHVGTMLGHSSKGDGSIF